MRRLAIALILAHGLVYPQEKPNVSREKMAAPKINTATDPVSFNQDVHRVSGLGIEEAKMQFMRAYERVDFDTWDRIVTQHRREMEAYFQKWDNHPIPGNGPQFRTLVRQRIELQLPKVRDEFYKKYGVPKRKVPGRYIAIRADLQADRRASVVRRKGRTGAEMGHRHRGLRLADCRAQAAEKNGAATRTDGQRHLWHRGLCAPVEGDTDPGAPIFSLPENHTIIISKTRTGKGTRVITPTLLRYFGSMLVIDPKGENAAVTARARYNVIEGLPFHVEILNPWGVLDGHFKGLGFERFATYNPLEILDRNDPNAVANAQTLAATICQTGGGDKGTASGKAGPPAA